MAIKPEFVKSAVEKSPATHPEVLFHFTSLFHLNRILTSKWITKTESNLTVSESVRPHVVWMTDVPTLDNHGLLFQDIMPDELNKTFYRIYIRWNNQFKLWDKWSAETGIKPETKRAIIETARAQETYKGWYISERIIPINDWVTIEDVRTRKVLFKWDNKKFIKIATHCL
ncbi:hypothetical protein [Gudongella oleilytica]|uniref:hypothetical protein n=1 Tax=Gudongella oleilytica TaxID=1582259 RepID=UPI002A36A1D3|nr:hypothetical protein [Gudongella oleilytica]MDY0256208.1 hypothetical protein [Gudongella oleilytica]